MVRETVPSINHPVIIAMLQNTAMLITKLVFSTADGIAVLSISIIEFDIVALSGPTFYNTQQQNFMAKNSKYAA